MKYNEILTLVYVSKVTQKIHIISNEIKQIRLSIHTILKVY